MSYLSCWTKSTRVDSTRGNSRGCSGSWLRSPSEPQPCRPLCWCWWVRSLLSCRSRRASTAAGRVASSASLRKASPKSVTKSASEMWAGQNVFAKVDWVNTVESDGGGGGGAVVRHIRNWRQSPKVTLLGSVGAELLEMYLFYHNPRVFHML